MVSLQRTTATISISCFKILRRDILAVIFGVLTIFGATLKIYYLAPAVGLVVALTISVLGILKIKFI